MFVLRTEGFDYFLYYPAKGHSAVRDINQAMRFETAEFALSYAGANLLRHVYKEAVQVEPIKVFATTANPLNNQLKALTGDGWNWYDWEGNLTDSNNIIKHKKTGLLVQVL